MTDQDGFQGPLIIVGTPMFKRPKMQITRISQQFGALRRPITVQSALSVGVGAFVALGVLQGIFGSGNIFVRLLYLVIGGALGWVLGNTTKRGDSHLAAMSAAVRRSNSVRRYVGTQPLKSEPVGALVLAHAAVPVSVWNYSESGELLQHAEDAQPPLLPGRKPDLFN